MANTCLYVLAILWCCSFYAHANTAAYKRHYQYIDKSLADVLIDVAKINRRQLIVQSHDKLHRKITISCDCTLEQILLKALDNSQFTFKLSSGGNLLVFPQKPIEKQITPIKKEADYEHILVTGYTSPKRSILRSSSAVTVVDQFDFSVNGKPSTAEMLKHVPGFWVEDSGGEVNNNVSPRGLRGGEGYRFISLMEDGLPVTYDGIWADFFIRQDLMIDKVETIRGGNSGILSVNGPAAVVNFLSVLPSSHENNVLSYSTGINYNYHRLDFSFMPEIQSNWQYVLGGFYRQSTGLKDPGYKGDRGGQLKLSVQKETAESSTKVILKYLNDTTVFYSPVVMQGKTNPRGVKGLPTHSGTLLTREFSDFNYYYPDDENRLLSRKFDIKDGQETKLLSAGFFYDTQLSSNWLFSFKTRFSNMNNSMLALLNLGDDSIFQAQELLSDLSGTSQQAELVLVKTGEIIDDLSKLENELLMFTYPLFSTYQQKLWVNKLDINWQRENVAVNIGASLIRGDYNKLPFDKWLGTFLTDVVHQPHRFDIKLTDFSSGNESWLTNQGALNFEGPAYIEGHGLLNSFSLYSTMNIEINDHLLLDFGLRNERLNLHSTSETDRSYQGHFKHFSTNYLSGNRFSADKSFNELAWSTGFNWLASENLMVYGHAANAFEMPRLTSFGNTIGWADYIDDIPQGTTYEAPVRLNFYEIGLRYTTDNLALTATLFETRFDPLLFSVYQGLNSHKSILIDTNTKGIEFEFNKRLSNQFSINGHGVWQNAQFTGIPKDYMESRLNGNQLTRTPDQQLALTLNYDNQSLSSFMSIHYVGKRFADVENSFVLPSYSYANLGFNWQLSNNINIQLVAKNIGNAHGLTEGNPRNSNSSIGNNYYFARSIFGRSLKANIEFIF